MKILMITLDFPPNSTEGSAVYAKYISILLSNTNEVHIVTTGEKTELIKPNKNLYIHRLYCSNLPFLKLPTFLYQLNTSIKKLISKYKIDLIHLNDIEGFPFSNLLPSVASIHHLSMHNFSRFSISRNIKNSPYIIMELITLKNVLHIFSDSTMTKRELTKKYNFTKNKMTVLHVPSYIKLPEKNTGFSTRRKYNIDKDTPLILAPGIAREERKGGAYLVQALKKLAVTEKYICIFTGKSREGNWESRLRKLSKPISSNVIYVGNIPSQDLYNLYIESDIVVFPSIFEGYGLPVIEAMMMKKPIIATRTGAASYFIDNYKNGIITNTKSVDEIYNSLIYLIKNPKKRSAMSKQGYIDINSKLDKKRIKLQIENIYKKVINHRKII